MSELVIREAEERDVDILTELDELCFSAPWSRQSFLEEMTINDLAFYIVAEIDGRVIGYAGLWIVGDEGHITNVAVHPEFRQKNIGSAIIDTLITVTMDNGVLSHTLEVRESNIAAQTLYKKFGFKNGGIRKKYYEDDGENALIMWRNIRD